MKRHYIISKISLLGFFALCLIYPIYALDIDKHIDDDKPLLDNNEPLIEDKPFHDEVFDGKKPIGINPLGRVFGDPNDPDPLKLGANPTPPAEQKVPALIDGSDIVPALPLIVPKPKPSLGATNMPNQVIKGPRLQNPNAPLNETAVFENESYVSDFMSILSPAGAALTVWALARGNWIWGYTLIDSIPFGDARIWQLIIFPNEHVMIKNAKTNTCLNAYGNGVVHQSCDQTNPMQFWQLIPMDNHALQIKNVQTHRCLQAPIGDILHDFHKVFGIYQTECAVIGQSNFDQQWYLIAPAIPTKPLYTLP